DMVTALNSSIAVFTQVTASGRRGWFGGGQLKLPARSTQYAVTSPAKVIVSKAIKTRTASCPLLIGGFHVPTGGSPPPNPRTTVSRRVTPRSTGWCWGRACAIAVSPMREDDDVEHRPGEQGGERGKEDDGSAQILRPVTARRRHRPTT